MPFNSFLFLLGFLPLALGGHALAGRLSHVSAKAWLLGVSVLFYGAFTPRFLPLLLLSVGGNLLLLQAIAMIPQRGQLTALGVALNLAVLGWFKYAMPFVSSDPVLPLGISFFTFTQIGGLLTYAASDEPPPKILDYALFVLFFPALTAGPILNAREMLPQFARTIGWRLSADNWAVGTGFFLIGLLKKTLLADPLSGIVGGGSLIQAHCRCFPRGRPPWPGRCNSISISPGTRIWRSVSPGCSAFAFLIILSNPIGPGRSSPTGNPGICR